METSEASQRNRRMDAASVSMESCGSIPTTTVTCAVRVLRAGFSPQLPRQLVSKKRTALVDKAVDLGTARSFSPAAKPFILKEIYGCWLIRRAQRTSVLTNAMPFSNSRLGQRNSSRGDSDNLVLQVSLDGGVAEHHALPRQRLVAEDGGQHPDAAGPRPGRCGSAPLRRRPTADTWTRSVSCIAHGASRIDHFIRRWPGAAIQKKA